MSWSWPYQRQYVASTTIPSLEELQNQRRITSVAEARQAQGLDHVTEEDAAAPLAVEATGGCSQASQLPQLLYAHLHRATSHAAYTRHTEAPPLGQGEAESGLGGLPGRRKERRIGAPCQKHDRPAASSGKGGASTKECACIRRRGGGKEGAQKIWASRASNKSRVGAWPYLRDNIEEGA